VLTKFLSYLKNLPQLRLILIGLGSVLILSALLVYVIANRKDDMVVLYSELNRSSVESILHRLEQENITHDLSPDGKTIRVEKDRVYKIRALLASEGLPESGSVVGYEIFDKEESLGTTNFLQNVKHTRAKQGELSRTIQAFDNVVKARVHLAIPQRELFSKESHLPTASVMLSLKSGTTLSASEVKAISHLVSRSVEFLKDKNITIVDSSGNVLQMGGEEDIGGFGSAYNMQHRSSYEKKMQAKIETLVSRIVGAGNMDVKVNADMHFDKVVTNSEIYDSDKVAIRSSHSKDNRERTPIGDQDGGDVSVSTNLPDSTAESENLENFVESRKLEDINNYEISKTIQNTISEVGTIKQISVAVLINDHYVSNSGTFVPRSEADMKKIEELVKAAIGYQDSREDKVIVVHMPFFKDEDNFVTDTKADAQSIWWKSNLNIVINSFFAFLALIVLLFYALRLRAANAIAGKKLANLGQNFTNSETSASQQTESGFDFQNQKFASTPIKANLEQLISKNPEGFFEVLRRWLNEK